MILIEDRIIGFVYTLLNQICIFKGKDYKNRRELFPIQRKEMQVYSFSVDAVTNQITTNWMA
jgi:hypothetical protein